MKLSHLRGINCPACMSCRCRWRGGTGTDTARHYTETLSKIGSTLPTRQTRRCHRADSRAGTKISILEDHIDTRSNTIKFKDPVFHVDYVMFMSNVLIAIIFILRLHCLMFMYERIWNKANTQRRSHMLYWNISYIETLLIRTSE